jgi:hypothetical protein
MDELEGNILFTKSSGSTRVGELEFEVKQEYVALQSKIGGVLIVNFSAPEKESKEIHDYFKTVTDMEPMKMNIAKSGDFKLYFKGISPLQEETNQAGETITKFSVTLQELIEKEKVL